MGRRRRRRKETAILFALHANAILIPYELFQESVKPTLFFPFTFRFQFGVCTVNGIFVSTSTTRTEKGNFIACYEHNPKARMC